MAKRTPIVAGNWKMNKTVDESETLAREVVAAVTGVTEVEIAICPTFTALDRVAKVVAGSNVGLGAQNVHWEASGAYTGEIAPAMLLTCGCRYVILGHSERRQYFGETDEAVNQRLKASLEAGLVPIVCVGETLEQREANVTERVVRDQVLGGLDGLDAEQVSGLVLAYEPVWAIGTGLTASPEQAEAVHATLRGVLEAKFGADAAAAVRIQYGGSMKPENAAELLSQPNIDGGLIGGAALVADSFAAIVNAGR